MSLLPIPLRRIPSWRSLAALLAVLPLFACQSTGPAPPVAASAPVTYSLGTAADGTPLPPVARVAPDQVEVAGRTLVDPYPWLERRGDPEVLSYLEAENLYTETVMAHAELLVERLYEEMVGRIEEDDLSVPYRLGGYYYFTRIEKGSQYPIYYRQEGDLDAIEEELLDVNQLAAGHAQLEIGAVRVSPDGKRLAFSYDTDGSERFTIRVKDLVRGELLPDLVAGASWDLEWGNDNRTLFYTTTDETYRTDRLWRHRLGSEQAADELLHHEPDAAYHLYLSKTKSGRYLLLSLESAVTTEVRLLDADRPDGELTTFGPRRAGIEYTLYHQGEHFYVRTNDGAHDFKLMRAPVADPSPSSWVEVIPHRPGATLYHLEAFASHLAIFERRGGLPHVYIWELADGTQHELGFPEPVYAVTPLDNPEYDSTVLRLRYTSMVTPPSIFDYDLVEEVRELKKQTQVVGGYDPSRYVTERVFATAPDGAAVPISLVYRTGLPRDGSRPCVLQGYGAYGWSLEPSFSSSRLSLLERGFVFAIAHVRGGGEMGEAWHEGGKLRNKKNTFTDFIAAAEHLVAEGYTSPARLAMIGRSAGGLLIGAVLNRRPDLFAAAVTEVPFVDLMNTMLDPTIPLTVTEWEEWGNPEEEEVFDYMLSYSPYDNIASRPYPSLLVMAALNDTRVNYWEAAKWVARLRATLPAGQRILLRTDTSTGHLGATGRYDSLRDLAFEYAFLLSVLGAG